MRVDVNRDFPFSEILILFSHENATFDAFSYVAVKFIVNKDFHKV